MSLNRPSSRCAAALAAVASFCACGPILAVDPQPPQVGQTAQDFTLTRVDGREIQLSQLCAQGPVVVLVLRGYPGYQCPICSRQVGQFLARQEQFAAAQANVVMIYPGPAEGLQAHAQEFVTGKTLPDRFHLLLDPDYSFTNAWGLRWDAVRETAYPSTFVVAPDRKVTFAKISHTHGDRANVADVLHVLQP